jgi:hypothetical protein
VIEAKGITCDLVRFSSRTGPVFRGWKKSQRNRKMREEEADSGTLHRWGDLVFSRPKNSESLSSRWLF